MRTIAFSATAAVCFLGVLVLSLYSGYVAQTSDFSDAWALSPAGLLLMGVPPRLLLYRSVCDFAGHYVGGVAYFGVYLKTCLIEAPFYLFLFRRRLGVGLATLVVANALTHPAVFFGFPCLFETYLTGALAAEAFAPLVEVAVAYGVGRTVAPGFRFVPCALIVTAANLVSWQVGCIW